MKLKRRDNMSLNSEKLNGKGVFSGNFGQQRRETVGSTTRRASVPTKQLAECNKNPQKANLLRILTRLQTPVTNYGFYEELQRLCNCQTGYAALVSGGPFTFPHS